MRPMKKLTTLAAIAGLTSMMSFSASADVAGDVANGLSAAKIVANAMAEGMSVQDAVTAAIAANPSLAAAITAAAVSAAPAQAAE